jgi:hypothetical protein
MKFLKKRKESQMDKQPTAAAEIDYEKLGKALAASLPGALSEANKPLLDAIGRLAPAPAPAGEAVAKPADANAPKPLTMEDLKRFYAEQAQSQQVTAARDAYISEKMKDLPGIYRNSMPITDDPGKLAAAEQKVRDQYKADYAATGATAANVNGNPPAGQKPADAKPDLSKLSGYELINLATKGQEAHAPTAAQATATAAASAPLAGAGAGAGAAK